MNNRKLGRFNIDADMINDYPEVARAVMGKVIVIRAEHMLATASLEYVAICDDFEDVEEGGVIPEYDIEAEQKEDGIDVSFLKTNTD